MKSKSLTLQHKKKGESKDSPFILFINLQNSRKVLHWFLDVLYLNLL